MGGGEGGAHGTQTKTWRLLQQPGIPGIGRWGGWGDPAHKLKHRGCYNRQVLTGGEGCAPGTQTKIWRLLKHPGVRWEGYFNVKVAKGIS